MRRLLATVPLLLASVAADAAEGMPQLDVKNPLTVSQVVWLAIIFLALYLLLSRWALPKVGEVLEQRAAVIAGDLESARTAKDQADAAVTELTQATREAQATAQARIGEAVARAKEETARQAAQQSAILDRQLADADRRIASSRDAAFGALREVAADTATAVIARLIGHAPERRAIETEVDEVMRARAAS